MAKTVAELQEEAKKKLAQDQKNDTKPQSDASKYEEAMSKIAFLQARETALQEQLNKSSTNEEDARLAQEAEKMRKEEEALKQEANIAQILNDALKTETPARNAEDGTEELSQKDLVGIMAETVGKAMEASSKLTMGEMDKKLAESNKQLTGLQKVVIDLLGSMSVENARRKHTDFDKFAEGAREVHSTHPSLSPEEAYLLHKAKKASEQPGKDKIETEKPSEPPQWTPDRPFSTSRVSKSSDEGHQPEGNPRQNFRAELSSAIDGYLTRQQK